MVKWKEKEAKGSKRRKRREKAKQLSEEEMDSGVDIGGHNGDILTLAGPFGRGLIWSRDLGEAFPSNNKEPRSQKKDGDLLLRKRGRKAAGGQKKRLKEVEIGDIDPLKREAGDSTSKWKRNIQIHFGWLVGRRVMEMILESKLKKECSDIFRLAGGQKSDGNDFGVGEVMGRSDRRGSSGIPSCDSRAHDILDGSSYVIYVLLQIFALSNPSPKFIR
jgi:hypothetical protein